MPGLGTSFGRGGATNYQQDLANSDCIVIEGSDMAECHPVGFQWVMEAKARGAKVVQIEGDPDSPISRGRLCPKGSASKQLVTSSTRVTKVRYRRPYGTEWEDDQGRRTRRTMGIASLGGATLDNEENYLMKKLYSAMGAIQIENQARI